MKFEKDKVYKVIHHDRMWRRNYIIFSPLEDTFFLDIDRSIKMYTHFTVSFQGDIYTKNDINHYGHLEPSLTGFDIACTLAPLTNNDYEDIKRAISELGKDYRYNRKLNKIIYESSDTI